MKFKHLLLSLTLAFFAIACSDSEKKDSEYKEVKNEETSHSNDHGVKSEEPQTLVYRVSLGVMPDMSHDGVGVRVANVREGRPGFKGGMKDNDIVIEIDGKPVNDLVEYTKILGSHKAGDSVVLTIKRGDKTIKANITFD